MECNAHLIDYLYGQDDVELKSEEIFVDQVKKLDIKEFEEENILTLKDYFKFDEDDDEILFMGKKSAKDVKFENAEWTGTILDGVEGVDATKDFKLFKAYNPTIKGKAKFWDTKKDTFVC